MSKQPIHQEKKFCTGFPPLSQGTEPLNWFKQQWLVFSVLHRKVGIVLILNKTIVSDFWTQSALTHTALGQISRRVTMSVCLSVWMSVCTIGYSFFLRPLIGLLLVLLISLHPTLPTPHPPPGVQKVGIGGIWMPDKLKSHGPILVKIMYQ